MKRYIKSTVQPIEDEPLETRFTIAEDFTLSRRVLERLAKYDAEPNVRNSAKRTLEILDDRDRFINDPTIDADLIAIFRNNAEPRVRWEIAQHPNISLEMLQELAHDEDFRVHNAAEQALRERGL